MGSSFALPRAPARLRVAVAALGLVLLSSSASPAEKPGANVKPAPAAEQAPLPPPRPDRAPEPKPDAGPPPKAATTPAREGATPSKDAIGPPKEAATPPKGPASADPTPCLDRLAKLGVKLEPMPPVAEGACGADHPFRLSTLPDGVKAAPDAQVGCPMAEAMARWIVDVVEPEADRHLGAAPKKVLIGTSYECRGQNRDAAAKLSEHAFANAVDVTGFTFEKAPALSVTARDEETPEGRFQAAIRSRACAYFSTVLGPGSDPSHATHLHLDLRERKAGYRICQ